MIIKDTSLEEYNLNLRDKTIKQLIILTEILQLDENTLKVAVAFLDQALQFCDYLEADLIILGITCLHLSQKLHEKNELSLQTILDKANWLFQTTLIDVAIIQFECFLTKEVLDFNFNI